MLYQIGVVFDIVLDGNRLNLEVAYLILLAYLEESRAFISVAYILAGVDWNLECQCLVDG